MVDSIADGRTRVYSVPTISNINAPTVAELNAGTQLEPFMTPDGLVGFEPETTAVDNSKLNSTFNTMVNGRVGYSGTMLRFIKQTGSDTIYNLLVRDYATNIVVRRDITATTAWAASQAVEVYPAVCGEVRNLSPAPNEMHRFEIPIGVTSQPATRATTA